MDEERRWIWASGGGGGGGMSSSAECRRLPLSANETGGGRSCWNGSSWSRHPPDWLLHRCCFLLSFRTSARIRISHNRPNKAIIITASGPSDLLSSYPSQQQHPAGNSHTTPTPKETQRHLLLTEPGMLPALPSFSSDCAGADGAASQFLWNRLSPFPFINVLRRGQRSKLPLVRGPFANYSNSRPAAQQKQKTNKRKKRAPRRIRLGKLIRPGRGLIAPGLILLGCWSRNAVIHAANTNKRRRDQTFTKWTESSASSGTGKEKNDAPGFVYATTKERN